MTNTTNAAPKMLDLIRAANKANGRTWDPTATPYRVGFYYDGTFTSNMFECATFATEAEARAVFEAGLPSHGKRAKIDLAVNVDAWTSRGRWQHVASRGRRARKNVAK